MNTSSNKIKNETPIIFNLPGNDKNVGKSPTAYSDSDNLSFSTEEDCDHDIISDYIGHYGRWQFLWTFLLCLFQIPTTFHIFCLVFQVSRKIIVIYLFITTNRLNVI